MSIQKVLLQWRSWFLALWLVVAIAAAATVSWPTNSGLLIGDGINEGTLPLLANPHQGDTGSG